MPCLFVPLKYILWELRSNIRKKSSTMTLKIIEIRFSPRSMIRRRQHSLQSIPSTDSNNFLSSEGPSRLGQHQALLQGVGDQFLHYTGPSTAKVSRPMLLAIDPSPRGLPHRHKHRHNAIKPSTRSQKPMKLDLQRAPCDLDYSLKRYIGEPLPVPLFSLQQYDDFRMTHVAPQANNEGVRAKISDPRQKLQNGIDAFSSSIPHHVVLKRANIRQTELNPSIGHVYR